MKAYYSVIQDYLGKDVLYLPYTGSAKHSAFLAQKYLEHVPPAQNFTIRKIYVSASDVALMLNQNYTEL